MSDQEKTPLLRYCLLLIKLHKLIANGKGDCIKADSLRDEMDRPYQQLNESDAYFASKISEYLYEGLEA